MPFHVSYNDYEEGHQINPGRFGLMIKEFRPGGPMPHPEFINTLLFEVALESSRLALDEPPSPSRLNCVFAYNSLEDATRFRDHRRNGAHIYEVIPVEDVQPLLRDAARLSGDNLLGPYATAYGQASKHYWQRTDEAADPELLYGCSLRVVRRV